MRDKMTSEKKHVLSLRDVYKDYMQAGTQMHVLRGVSATFEQGKTYAVTGVSGSGKSTMLHVLGGLDEPTGGSVLFDDKNIFTMVSSSRERFFNRKLGFVFQFHYLIKELTVRENIMIMGVVKGDSKDACFDRSNELLEMVGLKEKADVYPTQLSGGQQQRVSIARSMFNKPAFLIADEPTGNLDEDLAEQIVDLFLAGQKEWGMGLIICSHDPNVYKKMDTIYHLHHGHLELEKR